MIKYVNYDIVFQEFPDEVTLAINCSLCPNSCPGCHSAYLAGDIGDELTLSRLISLVSAYEHDITCVALMGGDNDPQQVMHLLSEIKKQFPIKTGWYSGRQNLPECFNPEAVNYVKLGPYIEKLGPLKSKTTNQRFYKVEDGKLDDNTFRFWKKGLPL